MISENDIRFLRLAETMAKYSDHGRVNIGSCIVKKKSVISTGCNKLRTHPQQLKYNRFLPYTINKPCLHAEMDAALKAGEEGRGSTIYVFRRGKDGAYRNCRPCESCMNKIRDIGIKRIVHTIYNGIAEMAV